MSEAPAPRCPQSGQIASPSPVQAPGAALPVPDRARLAAEDPRLLELLDRARQAFDELTDYLVAKCAAAGVELPEAGDVRGGGGAAAVLTGQRRPYQGRDNRSASASHHQPRTTAWPARAFHGAAPSASPVCQRNVSASSLV